MRRLRLLYFVVSGGGDLGDFRRLWLELIEVLLAELSWCLLLGRAVRRGLEFLRTVARRHRDRVEHTAVLLPWLLSEGPLRRWTGLGTDRGLLQVGIRVQVLDGGRPHRACQV